MRKLLSVIVLLGAAVTSQAQNIQDGTISGKLAAGAKPVESATINLLLAKDSSLVKAGLTDKSGNFLLEHIKNGRYLVQVDAMGYQKYYSAAFALTEQQHDHKLAAIELTAASQELNGVVVTAKKQFVEQHLDKTVVNVDASPSNAGLSALDVLEKSPGITVDKDGNVSLKGKGGVLILVDGKPTYLSATDLANLLKNMPSTNLDQIEIMTNPPAKYDAAGNSGVINIRTKKLKMKGLNGSVTLGAGIGHNPKSNNSFNINYRTGKVNLFGNYSYNYNKGYQTLDLTRNFRDQNTYELLNVFQQFTKMEPNYQSHTFKTGMDITASKKTTIGFVVNGYLEHGSFSSNNTTNILDAHGTLDSVTLAHNIQRDHFNNVGTNFNLRHTFDTAGRELTADLDYIHYSSGNHQEFQNIFYNNSNSKTQPDEFIRGELPSNINIYSAKVDYTHPLKHNAKFEAGAKSSYVKTDNNALYSTLQNDKWIEDAGRSNHFIYKENINAVYVNLNKQFSKKWSGQLGLRMENTNASGDQLTTDQNFKRNYTQLFPTSYIGYTLNDKNQFSLSYGRRIERPDYQDMNPFYYFLDKYTYQVGNPYLKPQFSHNIELNHTYGGVLTSSIGFSRTNDIIMDVLKQVDSTRTSFQTKANIAATTTFTASMSFNKQLTKWWRISLYGQGNYNHFKGFVNTGILDVSGFNFMTNFSNQFELKHNWGLELSGFYRSSSVEGTIVSKPMGLMNFAVSKQIMKKKGTIKLNIRDFANLQYFRGYSRYQNVDMVIKNHWDNRVVNISFTYRFSKGVSASPSRKGSSASDEEQNRVKKGGGN
ncbi:TonB-dependent receptor domain-containing protein [Deminuibacter soli]|uniref:TonB-dependent receptor n=1 Tax=Deminuibacter soli TaxID=2291815 RepID=A0A3E1NJU7_9BACT|nr:TonB-dependent receptor [Deminuibacter soli]RFM28104.1 TonB-dependent receptor [Deminuibacter soli]